MLTNNERTAIDNMKNRVSVEEIFRSLELMVNSFSVHPEEFVDEILGDKSVSDLFDNLSACWILCLNFMYSNNLYDGRNEYACRTASELMRDDSVKAFISSKRGQFEQGNVFSMRNYISENSGAEIAARMTRSHRTLQQTFSRYIFLYIKKKVGYEKLNGIDTWWRCPMI